MNVSNYSYMNISTIKYFNYNREYALNKLLWFNLGFCIWNLMYNWYKNTWICLLSRWLFIFPVFTLCWYSTKLRVYLLVQLPIPNHLRNLPSNLIRNCLLESSLISSFSELYVGSRFDVFNKLKWNGIYSIYERKRIWWTLMYYINT